MIAFVIYEINKNTLLQHLEEKETTLMEWGKRKLTTKNTISYYLKRIKTSLHSSST